MEDVTEVPLKRTFLSDDGSCNPGADKPLFVNYG